MAVSTGLHDLATDSAMENALYFACRRFTHSLMDPNVCAACGSKLFVITAVLTDFFDRCLFALG